MGKKKQPVGFGLSKQARAKKKSKSTAGGEEQRNKGDRAGLRAVDSDKCLPPVFADSDGMILQDPWATLGLKHGDPVDGASVEAAFQEAVRVTTPEKDPEGARALMEARRFLLDPENVFLRELGDLRVPDPEAFLPGYQLSETVRDLVESSAAAVEPREGSPETPKPAPPSVAWSSHSRIATLMTLLALVEAEIHGDLSSTPLTILPPY